MVAVQSQAEPETDSSLFSHASPWCIVEAVGLDTIHHDHDRAEMQDVADRVEQVCETVGREVSVEMRVHLTVPLDLHLRA